MIWLQKYCGVRRTDQAADEGIVGHRIKANKRIVLILSMVGHVPVVVRLFKRYGGQRRRDLVRSLAAALSVIGIIAGGSAMALLCFSCATPLQESLETRQAHVEALDPSDIIRKAILTGRVVPGMTKEDVYVTWGQPSEMDTSETLGLHGQYGKEVWIYGSFLSLTPEAEVFFRNGVVYSVSPGYLSDVPRD